MSVIKKLIMYDGWFAIYLSFAIGEFGNLHWHDWQFYAILVPTAFFVAFINTK